MWIGGGSSKTSSEPTKFSIQGNQKREFLTGFCLLNDTLTTEPMVIRFCLVDDTLATEVMAFRFCLVDDTLELVSSLLLLTSILDIYQIAILDIGTIRDGDDRISRMRYRSQKSDFS